MPHKLQSTLTLSVDPTTPFVPLQTSQKAGPNQEDHHLTLPHSRSHGLFYLNNCGFLCELTGEEVERVLAVGRFRGEVGGLFTEGTRREDGVRFEDNR